MCDSEDGIEHSFLKWSLPEWALKSLREAAGASEAIGGVDAVNARVLTYLK